MLAMARKQLACWTLTTIWRLFVCNGQDPEVNPELGVPGFPDCVRQGPAATDFIAAAKALSCSPRQGPLGAIKIACVGDSITAGAWAKSREHTYPSQLQRLLDKEEGEGKYVVTNLGAAGSTAQLIPGASDVLSYVNTPQYDALVQNKFDIVLFMIGTNDAMQSNWPHSCTADTTGASCRFSFDFSQLINKMKERAERVVVMTPLPIMSTEPLHWGLQVAAINQYFPYLVPILANSAGVEGLDMFSIMGGLPTWPSGYPDTCIANEEFFIQFSTCRFFCDDTHCDGVHPTDFGYQHMADATKTVVRSPTPILQ
jgi:lysophospholipase L1-like esterase